MRASAAGSTRSPSAEANRRLVLAPDPTEVDFHWPVRLRDDGKVVLVAHRKAGPRPVAVVTLRDGSRKNLREFEGVGNAVYSATGHLLLSFSEGRQRIVAVPFSDSSVEITGEPFVVAPGAYGPSASADGARITYTAGSSRSLRELVFLTRDGRTERVVGPPQLGLDFPAISPDGTSVAVTAVENENADLWLQDLARGTRRRLVASPRNELFPSWSRDGKRLVYGEEGNVEPDAEGGAGRRIGRPPPHRRGGKLAGVGFGRTPSCSSGTSPGRGSSGGSTRPRARRPFA